ncbi:MAG: radical SAM family heme chaperone HemW [Bacteroidales bacterium]
MSGIYIHIPFCKKRCHYCDFFSSTHEDVKSRYVKAVCKEAEIRKNEIPAPVTTIYIGGGTPSQLTTTEIKELFDSLGKTFDLSAIEECTFEANPDDITPELLSALKDAGVNRLSMGIQSFNDALLKKLNRRHSASEAIAAVKLAQSMGFENISIDLMYGLPGQNPEDWNRTLDIALELNVPHISSYHLTYEEGTILYEWLQKGVIRESNEELSLQFFETLISRLAEKGYEQYEISNFAKDKRYAKHNSSYWQNKPYLGLGASAHSFDLQHRSWNPSSMDEYLKILTSDVSLTETEDLDETTRYNDYIITSLRTKWGAEDTFIEKNFRSELLIHFRNQIRKHLETGNLKTGQGLGYCENTDNRFYSLTHEGIFISDSVFEDLLWVD